jgi:hypothetical protein
VVAGGREREQSPTVLSGCPSRARQRAPRWTRPWPESKSEPSGLRAPSFHLFADLHSLLNRASLLPVVGLSLFFFLSLSMLWAVRRPGLSRQLPLSAFGLVRALTPAVGVLVCSAGTAQDGGRRRRESRAGKGHWSSVLSYTLNGTRGSERRPSYSLRTGIASTLSRLTL